MSLSESNPDLNGRKLGPYWLTPGVMPFNAATFCLTTFIAMSLFSFFNFIQPYIIKDVLGVARENQGAITGNLHVLHEVVAILTASLVGTLSDRTGRRILAVVGLMTMAVGFFLYPLAGSIAQLAIFRIIYAIGTATLAVMISSLVHDYPQGVSRGKFNGLSSIFNSLGIIFMSLVLTRLPGFFESIGNDTFETARYTYWVTAVMAFAIGLFAFFGLKKGPVVEAQTHTSLLSGVGTGLTAARHNPRIALTFMTAFAGRGDIVVVGIYFSLWMIQAGASTGMTSSEALARGGLMFAAIQAAALAWAPIMGLLMDRLNRVTGLAIAMSLASASYLVMGQMNDPFNVALIVPACIFLGMGEVSAIISAAALFGQEAPVRTRGAIVGVYYIFGTLGIMAATYFGGQLFDAIGPTAPFTMMGIINFTVVLAALYVRRVAGEPKLESVESTAAE